MITRFLVLHCGGCRRPIDGAEIRSHVERYHMGPHADSFIGTFSERAYTKTTDRGNTRWDVTLRDTRTAQTVVRQTAANSAAGLDVQNCRPGESYIFITNHRGQIIGILSTYRA